jgi:hypothetical protein
MTTTDVSVDQDPTATNTIPGPKVSYRVLLAAAFVILWAEWTAMLKLIRHHGAIISGDESHYLVGAVSIGRFFTLNMNPGYNFAVLHHIIYAWTAPPGPHLASMIGQVHLSHGIYFLTHAIGLSVLLALPMLAGTGAAQLTLIAVLAALAVGLVHLTGVLSGNRSPWRVAIAGLFLAPAVALAATQVYPDLISGFVMAVIVMIMATVELRLELTTSRLVAAALSFVVLPWFDQKNILLTLVLLVAWVILWMHTRGPWSQLRWVVVPTLVSLAGLVALNLYSIGHLLGLPQPISLVSVNTWTRAVGLLFDRRQGLFTQLPIAVLGVAGLWTMRRRLPVAVVTSVVVLVATIYGNATQEISFGGGSLAGRFQWPTLPLLLGFAGLFLLELWRVRRRATEAVVVGIGALFALQLVPIVRNEHVLYNQIGWDPITYTGWWGGLDPSPVLGYIGGVTLHDLVPPATKLTGIAGTIATTDPWGNARALWGLACLVLVAVTSVYVLVHLLNRPSRLRLPIIGAAAGGIVLTLVMALSSSYLLPSPVTFMASQLPLTAGAPQGTAVVVSGSSRSGPVVQGPYWRVLPGTYVATINYQLTSGDRRAASGSVLLVTRPPAQGVITLASGYLPADRSTRQLLFTVHQTGLLVIRASWNGSGRLRVDGFVLEKLSPVSS